MLSGIGGYSGVSQAMSSQRFSNLDTDGSGTVSEEEFVAGRPEDVSAEDASKLYSALDSEGTDALSYSDMASAFQQMSSAMQTVMLQSQATSQSSGPDFSEMFSDLDTDGDGTLTEEEFLAGKPDDVSDEQAAALWKQISGDSDSLTEEEFTSGMASAAPPPPPSNANSSGLDFSEMFSDLDTDGDGTLTEEEFLAGKPDDVSDEQAAALWKQIAGDNDSVTEEEFTSGMTAAAPPAPPSGGSSTSSSSDSEDETYDPLDTNEDGVVSLQEYLAGQLGDDSEDAVSSLYAQLTGTSSSDDSTLTSEELAQQLLAATSAYSSANAKQASGSSVSV